MFFDQKPKTLRIMAWIAFGAALLPLLAIAATFITGAPEWNRFDRFGEACTYALIGALLLDLAATREEASR